MSAQPTFSELSIVKDGVGLWHVNRFRISFMPPWSHSGTRTDRGIPALDLRRTLEPLALARELPQIFPTVFNGAFEGGAGNVVVVERSSAKWGEYPTLRFTMDTFGPDLHSDWVGVNWLGQDGFAVQTLAINDGKIGAAGIVAGVPAALCYGVLLGGVRGVVSGVATAIAVDAFNDRHFLEHRSVGKPEIPIT